MLYNENEESVTSVLVLEFQKGNVLRLALLKVVLLTCESVRHLIELL